MNKYQKERSREIRDIMRTDVWDKMTYKEARRQWRSGIRAFRCGDTHIWKSYNLAHLGFSRSKMREVGQAYYKIYEYCVRNGLTFTCEYEPFFDSYQFRFKGGYLQGRPMYASGHAIARDRIMRYGGSVVDIADWILKELDRQLTNSGFIAPEHGNSLKSLYPRMIVHPFEPRSVEVVFGGIVARG
jgi:hypothetical protein